ncbi:MAG: HD domain-containing protein [Eubacterium sp.]|nr:HD domain-containing protein [Eubacterium sp.]
MSRSLPNTNQLFSDPEYQHFLKKTEACEKNRPFCRHDLKHFIDVARIANLLALEEGLSVSADLIYTTALLHDIGRFEEYEKGTPHELASRDLAKKLLPALNFTEAEQAAILSAIENHRNPQATGFDAVFYRADKASRACYDCPAEPECRWSDEKKNFKLSY